MAYLQIANSRGGKVLVVDSYRYEYNKITDTKIYWRCGKCKAVYLHTNNFDLQEDDPRIELKSRPRDHNHHPDPDLVACTNEIQTMLARIRSDPSKPIKRVYNEVLIESRDIRQIPPWDSIRSRLARERGKVLPPIPHHLGEVEIGGTWAESWNGAPFLSKLDNQDGYAVFATQRSLQRLARCSQVGIAFCLIS